MLAELLRPERPNISRTGKDGTYSASLVLGNLFISSTLGCLKLRDFGCSVFMICSRTGKGLLVINVVDLLSHAICSKCLMFF